MYFLCCVQFLYKNLLVFCCFGQFYSWEERKVDGLGEIILKQEI